MIKDRIDWRVACVAIICLTLLEVCAMFHGINGTVRTIVFSLIALIVGIKIERGKLK